HTLHHYSLISTWVAACSVYVLFHSRRPRLRSSTLFPYTTLFRSDGAAGGSAVNAPPGAGSAKKSVVPPPGALSAQIRPPWASRIDRKSTRLNSSHVKISYAVFCLKKKKRSNQHDQQDEIARNHVH